VHHAVPLALSQAFAMREVAHFHAWQVDLQSFLADGYSLRSNEKESAPMITGVRQIVPEPPPS
jgi:hypothetical protein